MKASELRIGNYVEPAEPEYKGQYFRVRSGDIKHIQDGSKLYKYKSIPLTPEILEKAGFSLSDNFIWTKDDVVLVYEQWILRFYFAHDKWRDITSLHQLQNLYFALTGEELPIEL